MYHQNTNFIFIRKYDLKVEVFVRETLFMLYVTFFISAIDDILISTHTWYMKY